MSDCYINDNCKIDKCSKCNSCYAIEVAGKCKTGCNCKGDDKRVDFNITDESEIYMCAKGINPKDLLALVQELSA